MNLVFKTAVKEMAAAVRAIGHVHGQAPHRRRRGRAVTSTPACGRSTASSLMAGGGRPRHERSLPLVPRRPDGDGAASSRCSSPRTSTATSGSSRRVGRRPPSPGAPTTAPSGSASSVTVRGCGSSHASRAPTPTRTTPSRPPSPGASTASGTDRAAGAVRRQRVHGGDLPADSVDLRRSDRPVAHTARSLGECFGDDVHHHVLRHAEFEWQSFNATVTDWERRRYFERI